MKRLLSGLGSFLLGVLWLAGIALLFIGGARVLPYVEPWLGFVAATALLIGLPICLAFLIFRKTRRWGGAGIYFLSWPLGLWVWAASFAYAVTVSFFWTVLGIVMGGVGIVPIAAIMTLIRRDWASFGSIIGTVVAVFALRGFGAWIVEKSEQWDAAAKERVDAFKEHAVKKANYFARHWRGQLSLGVSYWVNGILAGLLLGFATIAVQAVQKEVSLRTASALSLLLYALTILSTVWWGVGVWRSASNHFSRGGTRFWAGAAKVMVVLSFVSNSVLTCTSYIPQSIELVSIVAGDAGIPPYQIRVLWGGTDIEFRGGLRAGSARELKQILAAVPQAKVLHIESPGGRIREAEEMMELVREHGLTTYTSEECKSAATLVLMSGKERVITANAKVGFHAGTFPGLTAEQRRGTDDLVRSTMQAAGVSEEFVDRVLATPPDQMWYPSYQEMLSSGVVTSQSYGERFAASISPSDLDALIEKLGVSPWYRTIRELEPEVYKKMINDLTAAIQSGKSEGEAIGVVAQTADTMMKKYYAAAADKALLVVLRDDWISILRNYKDIDSRACIAYLNAGELRVNAARASSDWNLPNRARTNEMVMRSGASKIPVWFDRNAAEYDFVRIMESLKATYASDMPFLETPAKWMDNSQKVCDMLLDMFEQIAALPENRAANVIRYFLTLKSTDETQAVASVPALVTYHVVKTDVLNLRAGPGANYPVVAKLPTGTSGIKLGDGHTANGTTMWQEVSVNGYTGWVNEIYIEAEPEIRKAKAVR